MARMTKSTTTPVSLFDKHLTDRTPLETLYLEAFNAVRTLSTYATEAEEALQTACESGEVLLHPLPFHSIGDDWHLVGRAAAAERALAALLTTLRATHNNN